MAEAPLTRWFRPLRTREAFLWLLVVAGVLNFTPALFRGTRVPTEPAVLKGIKDVVLLAVLVAAAGAYARLPAWPRGSAGARELVHGLRSARPEPLADMRLWERRLLAGLAALAVFMLVTTMVLRPPLSGFGVSFRYYVVYPLMIWAVATLATGAGTVQRVLKLVCVLGAVEGVLALFNFLGYPSGTFYSNYVEIDGLGYARGIGTLGNPDNLGIFLGLPILLLLAGATYRGAARWLMLACCATGALLTFSKSVGAALVVGVAVLLFQQRATLSPFRRRLASAGAVALGVAFVAFAVAGRSAGPLNAKTFLGGRTETFEVAWEEWIASLDLFLFGGGFGSLVLSAGSGGVREFVTDSMILTLALEGGLLALVLFGFVVFAGLQVLRAAVRETPGPTATGLVAYAVFFLPYAAVLVNFRLFPAALLFWSAIGLARAQALEAGREPP